MAHKIALVTDSTCDIPNEWVEKYEITVVPMTVIFGDKPYLDGRDITPVEFYERLLADPIRNGSNLLLRIDRDANAAKFPVSLKKRNVLL